MRHWFVLASIVLAGCARDYPDHPVLGTRADVTTQAGQYTGFRVVTACPTTFADIGVIGTGARVVTQDAEISSLGQQLHTRLTDLKSVWGWGGYGLVCESGVGATLNLDDWRDVDTVIARAGAFLAEQNVAMQIGINVDSIPGPVAE